MNGRWLVAVLFAAVAAYAAAPVALSWLRTPSASADAATRQRLSEQASRRSTWPGWRDLPAPRTLVRADTPFGRFAIPLSNLASRDQFDLRPVNPLRSPGAPEDARQWASPSLAFWMPDGAGVLTDPSGLLEHRHVDPVDLRWRSSVLRPREQDRPDSSAERFVVVVGRLCPRETLPDPPPARSGEAFPFDPGQGWPLLMTGYGYGALRMWSCAVERPDAPLTGTWTSTPIPEAGRSEMFCKDDFGACFGWIDLAEEGMRALAYIPRDAVGEVPAVADRLRALLREWRASAN